MSDPLNELMPSSLATFTGSVFHYTSSAGLLGSLESKPIRASAASSLNDLGEVRQGWSLIEKLLAAMPNSEAVDLLKEFAGKPMQGEHEVFVLSASTYGDDASQWRLYADGGRGYAIELDSSVSLAAVSDVPAASASSGTLNVGTFLRDAAAVSPWQKVLYSDVEVSAALNELVATLEGEIRKIEASSDMPEEERDFAYDSLRGNAYEALSTIAHLIKSPGFSGENEVRVVATFMWGQEHIHYRPGAHGIVGYVNLAEAPGGPRRSVLRPTAEAPLVTSLPVKSIRLGPLLRPEHEKTLQAFLRANGLRHVAIETSTVPLR